MSQPRQHSLPTELDSYAQDARVDYGRPTRSNGATNSYTEPSGATIGRILHALRQRLGSLPSGFPKVEILAFGHCPACMGGFFSGSLGIIANYAPNNLNARLTVSIYG